LPDPIVWPQSTSSTSSQQDPIGRKNKTAIAAGRSVASDRSRLPALRVEALARDLPSWAGPPTRERLARPRLVATTQSRLEGSRDREGIWLSASGPAHWHWIGRTPRLGFSPARYTTEGVCPRAHLVLAISQHLSYLCFASVCTVFLQIFV
jgi:hypothetical protein